MNEGMAAPARRSGTVDRPVGHGRHDHLCWIYDRPAAWREAAVAFLTDGAADEERLLYVADRDRTGLAEDLAALPGRAGMLASGQLTLLPISSAYGPPGQFQAARQIAAFRRLALRAVADGYRGLRLASEASSLVTGDPSDFTGYELLVDDMVTRTPLLSLCGYDQQRVTPAAVDALCFVHPLRHRPDVDAEEGMFADGRGGWQLRGALDITTVDHLRLAMSALPATGEVHLHLDRLRFCDAAATRVLVSMAARRHPAGRLVLHDAPPLLRRVLGMGWPGDNPGLEVVRR